MANFMIAQSTPQFSVLHCAFRYKSSFCLPVRMQSHIGCSCLTFSTVSFGEFHDSIKPPLSCQLAVKYPWNLSPGPDLTVCYFSCHSTPLPSFFFPLQFPPSLANEHFGFWDFRILDFFDSLLFSRVTEFAQPFRTQENWGYIQMASTHKVSWSWWKRVMTMRHMLT